jgi:hypothetical protein
MLDGFPLSTGASEAIPLTLSDLDGDGDIEIAPVSEKGYIFIWDLPGTYSEDTVSWGYYRHDPQNTGMNPQRLQPVAAGEDWFPENFAYNYPNPAKGSYTTIRYRLEESADVRIKIYDLAGELIDELDGPGIGLTENEVNWDLEGVESGVYFGRIHAESARGTRTITIKIAISK